MPASCTLPALSFYVLRVGYLVWAGSPDRYVRKIILVIYTPVYSTLTLSHGACILYSLYSAVELYSSTAVIHYTSSTAPLRSSNRSGRTKVPAR